MTHKNFCFKIWMTPHAWIALGRATQRQLHIVYVDGFGLCDEKFTLMQDMFRTVADMRNNTDFQGWGLSIIDDDYFDEEYRILQKRYGNR